MVFWFSRSLELSAFLSIVIFSLGLVGPIMSVFTFTDDLAVLGTNVEEISQLLNAEELDHKDTPVNLADTSIGLDHVSFSYDGENEVLADMLELGDISFDSHRRVGQFAVREKTDMVIAYGDEAKAIAAAVEALGGKAYWCAGRDEAAKLLDSLLQSHDIVLLKGSHSMQVDSLLELVLKNKQL